MWFLLEVQIRDWPARVPLKLQKMPFINKNSTTNPKSK